ncbi:MAG: peptide-methionine (S)-S-oxide reductase MsrA [Desulfuromonadales bacterium]|nr:peptide-methionine (S)-S-oxide reductase MsrA [Desulfuromonadales bacterium]
MNEPVRKSATFAGGCFWCLEPPFEKLPGVLSVLPGYTGGTVAEPSYEEVCSGETGHAEAVQIVYDPQQVGYRELLEIFWRNIDPTDPGGQFADRGSQYRSAIFFHDGEQEREARESKARLEASGKFDRPIRTEIVPAAPFYPAEEYHRQYHRKEPGRYQRYRWGSGRQRFIEQAWGDKEGEE